MHSFLNYGLIAAGAIIQAQMFVGLPIPFKKFGYCVLASIVMFIPWPREIQTHLYISFMHFVMAVMVFSLTFAVQFKHAVLAFVNEQSLWLMTLLYWYFIYRYPFMSYDRPWTWALMTGSVLITGLVGLATFTRIKFHHRLHVIFYLWYLGLDLYISSTFFLKSPANVFAHIATSGPFDYFYFGLIGLHLICLAYYIFWSFPWPLKTGGFNQSLQVWHQHMSALGSRYLDRQVKIYYPLTVTIITGVLLFSIPKFVVINEFALVGTILAVGTWITGQRSGMTPKGYSVTENDV